MVDTKKYYQNSYIFFFYDISFLISGFVICFRLILQLSILSETNSYITNQNIQGALSHSILVPGGGWGASTQPLAHCTRSRQLGASPHHLFVSLLRFVFVILHLFFRRFNPISHGGGLIQPPPSGIF